MLWGQAKEGYAKWKNMKSCQSTQTCWTLTGSTVLLALRQNSNSHEPAAWHALGCAASLSCHLQHIKPSVDCRNLCPLQSICSLNPWGIWIGHIHSAAMIIDVSIMSPDVHPPNHLTDHLICDLSLFESGGYSGRIYNDVSHLGILVTVTSDNQNPKCKNGKERELSGETEKTATIAGYDFMLCMTQHSLCHGPLKSK